MNIAEASPTRGPRADAAGSRTDATGSQMDAAGFRAGLRDWLDDHDLSPGPDRSLDGQVGQLARVRRALWVAGGMR